LRSIRGFLVICGCLAGSRPIPSLDFFARMVQPAPMRRLVYPAGFDPLPRVREAVLADVENRGLAGRRGFG